jgi:hypothetical protein
MERCVVKKAVVAGMIGSFPLGGVSWDYGQYLLGFEQLGFEVYYLEDTGSQTYNPETQQYGENCSYAVRYIADALTSLSPTLSEHWHFKGMDGDVYGMPERDLKRIIEHADIFLNVSGGTILRDEYMSCPHKVLIDTDPGWNHFRNFPVQDAFGCLQRGDREGARRLLETVPGTSQRADLDEWWNSSLNWHKAHSYRAHDHFFTYAQRIGKPGCKLPELGIKWYVTRPPVILDCWHPQCAGDKWTTVMTWKSFPELVQHDGWTYGGKELEFHKIEELPACMPGRGFELALGGTQAPIDRWQSRGWNVLDARTCSRTGNEYRSYVERSRGEVSIAKNVYVATRSGWFSCRSVCFLAAGRPVVLQDTGYSDTIPTGSGLFAFNTLEEAHRAIVMIEDEYEAHSLAAREIARSHFDAKAVLSDLLGQVGL